MWITEEKLEESPRVYKLRNIVISSILKIRKEITIKIIKYFERNYKNHISVPLEYCLGHWENHVAPNTCIYKKKILRKKYYKPDQVVRK